MKYLAFASNRDTAALFAGCCFAAKTWPSFFMHADCFPGDASTLILVAKPLDTPSMLGLDLRRETVQLH